MPVPLSISLLPRSSVMLSVEVPPSICQECYDKVLIEYAKQAKVPGFHLDTEESDNLVPGFMDAIVGVRPGETKSFPLQFSESWEQENLRGVNAQFTVECKELFFRELPKLDDSLAEKLVPGCTTLNEVSLHGCVRVHVRG